MKQKLNLQADLKKYVRKYILKRIIPCVCLFSALCTVLILWGETVFNTKGNISWRVFYYGLTLAIPFLVTGVPLKLCDRTYAGTVDNVEVSVGVAVTDKSVRAVSDYYYNKNWNSKSVVYLTVNTTDERKIRKKAHEELSKFNTSIDKYAKGAKVFHLYGTKEIIIFPTEADTHAKCCVCGGINRKTENHCEHCGYSLVKSFREIFL